MENKVKTSMTKRSLNTLKDGQNDGKEGITSSRGQEEIKYKVLRFH